MSDDPDGVAPVADPVTGYQLRTVRIGTTVTVLTLVALAGYTILPGHPKLNGAVIGAVLFLGALSALIVALLPWERWFESRLGQRAMYVWAAADITLVTIGVAATDGGRSDVWAVYLLIATFFAASYPPRAQAVLLPLTACGYAIGIVAGGGHISAATALMRFGAIGIVYLMAKFLSRELRTEMERHADASLRASQAESQARRSEWFRSLVQDSSDVVTTFDAEGHILYVSPAVRSFGYEPDDLIGTFVSELVHPDDVDGAIDQLWRQVDSGEKSRPIEYRARTADGAYRYLEGVATNMLDEPTINAIVVDARDVHERKMAEMLVASQSRVLEQIASGEPIHAVLRRIAVMVEEQTESLCTVVMQNVDDSRLIVVSSDRVERDAAAVGEQSGWSRAIRSADGISVLGEVRLRFTTPRFATEREQQAADAAANLAAIAMERDFVKARLAHQARHDTLTGLANRQVFLETLEHALTSAVDNETLAVLFIDLDGFKDINDNFGHHVGDQVLFALGHRLAGAMRQHDVLARFGGDEFVALCRVEGADHAMHLSDRILAKVREPISMGSNRVRLDASIGITLATVMADAGPHWSVNGAWVQAAADELLREADAAMYRAKQVGGGRAELHITGAPHLRAAGDSEA